MRHIIPLAATAAGLALLAGCTTPVQHRDGLAAPVGAASPGTSAPAPAATSASTSAPAPSRSAAGSPSETGPPPATVTTPAGATTGPTPTPTRTGNAAPVLGPTGLGKLKIGMTVAQARATDMIVSYQGGGTSCGYSRLRNAPADGGTVTHSPRKGIIAIAAYGSMRTPEGIKIGSSLDQVQRAYADFVTNPDEHVPSTGNGRSRADEKDGNKVHYRITFRGYRVVELELEHDQQDCYE